MDYLKPGIGHSCQGGGAIIKNSPINIHIHIHTNKEAVAAKISRVLNGIFNRERHIAIEDAALISKDDLQGRIIRSIEN